MAYYQQEKEFEERIVETKRVSKKTKGGNKPGFTALVVVGNKAGQVGHGLGKAPNISSAIQKGIKVAHRNLVSVNITNDTIAHEIEEKFKSSYLKIKPAPQGSGIIAGGVVRHVMELAGVKNVSAKMIGSGNKSTNVRCAINALTKVRKKDE